MSSQTEYTERKYLNCLAQIEAIGPGRYAQLSNYFNSAEKILSASVAELEQAGLRHPVARDIYQEMKKLDPDTEWQKLERLGISIITIKDPEYSQLLKEIYHPPFVLYYKGNVQLFKETCLAVVGTRKISSYGQQVVPLMVKPLVASDLTIVSGLALGVDALAHQACLESNGNTIAVLGSGIDQIYPASNRQLGQKIIEHGLLISEYPPGSQPLKHHFPYRNRIISGLSLGTVVIEGTSNSGSLITAKYALDQNREIFAVPGNILYNSSSGTNKLIKMGAKATTSADDILESLNISQIHQFQQAKKIIPDNKEEEIILKILSGESMHIDKIIKATELDTKIVGSTLSVMEIKGKVRDLGGNNYVIAV